MKYDITERDMREVMATLEEYKRDRQELEAPATEEEAWHNITHAYYEARDELGAQDPDNDRAYVRALAAECLGYLINLQEDDDEQR